MNKEMLREVIESITEQADEIKSKSEKGDADFGALIAYSECLSIIKDACDEEELKEFGLDFDIEKKYIY